MESYAYFLVILTRNLNLYFILMALSKPSEVTASLNESTTTDFQTESYGSFLTLYKWLLRKKKNTATILTVEIYSNYSTSACIRHK